MAGLEEGRHGRRGHFSGGERFRGGLACVDRPILRISAADLDVLMGTLEVRHTELEECTLRNARRFEPDHDGMTRLYYGICGSGSITTAQGLSIAVAPYTLVIVPPAGRWPGPPRAAPRENQAMLAGSARILCGRFRAAFGDVVDMLAAKPGAAHTVESLARTACLSRSTFMARFRELMGRTPMSVLRDLRMRQAAQQLRGTGISIGQIGEAAGYANSSGFIRVFRRAHGLDPREYRGKALPPHGDVPHPVFDTDPPDESRSC